jgi:hypothetical protein
MRTAARTQDICPAYATSTTQEPKRLSKAGIWRRENPGGMFVILDRRAVNK